jgi:hypothetical protein
MIGLLGMYLAASPLAGCLAAHFLGGELLGNQRAACSITRGPQISAKSLPESSRVPTVPWGYKQTQPTFRGLSVRLIFAIIVLASSLCNLHFASGQGTPKNIESIRAERVKLAKEKKELTQQRIQTSNQSSRVGEWRRAGNCCARFWEWTTRASGGAAGSKTCSKGRA